MIDYSTVQSLIIPDGEVILIEDGKGNVLWQFGQPIEPVETIVLEVEKITSNTYAGETLYENEKFILLDIYPKNSSSVVKVTYGGLTKILVFSGMNSQQVFFGTFNGVTDSVSTPDSGTLTIERDCRAVSTSTFVTNSKSVSARASVVTAIHSLVDVSEIPSSAFSGCEKISSVSIPSSVWYINQVAFYNCINLKNVILSEGIRSIYYGAFYGCPLTSIKIPSSVTSISSNPFDSDRNNFITVDEGNLHYKIDNNCLVETSTNRLVSGFINSVIPTYIKNIGNYAFHECTGLTNIVLPDGVESIGASAFSNCTGLTNITIPASVSNLGYIAFTGCSALKDFTVLATTPPTVDPTIFRSDMIPSITVPKGCGEAYKAAEGWSEYADYIVEAS